jgi:hypothetical protein
MFIIICIKKEKSISQNIIFYRWINFREKFFNVCLFSQKSRQICRNNRDINEKYRIW